MKNLVRTFIQPSVFSFHKIRVTDPRVTDSWLKSQSIIKKKKIFPISTGKREPRLVSNSLPYSTPTTICYNWAIPSGRGQFICREINRQYASLSHVALLTLSAQHFSLAPYLSQYFSPSFTLSSFTLWLACFQFLPSALYSTNVFSTASVLSVSLFLSVLYGSARRSACPEIFLSVWFWTHQRFRSDHIQEAKSA